MLNFDAVPTTIIGSLPCPDAAGALDLLERYPLAVPAWPQLPKRSVREGMIFQFSEGFPGIRIDEKERRIWIENDDHLPARYAAFYESALSGDTGPFAVSADYAAGLAAFLERRAATGGRLPAVKGQVTGPFTLGLSLDYLDGKACWFDEQYRDIMLKALARKALWQAGRLELLAENVIIFFDEPIFAALGTPAYIGISDDDVIAAYTELCAELHAAGILAGIHCCGNMDWSLLTRTPADIISFDAYSFGEKVALYAAEIDAFLARGGWLAWGLVPTGSAELAESATAASLIRRRDELASLFEQKGVARSRLMKQMLLTPSCGMGTLPVRSAERVLDLLHQLRQVS
jgi:methionine synthase II (cobalamin-independent)